MPMKAIESVITVCLYCKLRHVGCHSTCEDYMKQKAEHDRLMKQKRIADGVRNEKRRQTEIIKLRHTKKMLKDG